MSSTTGAMLSLTASRETHLGVRAGVAVRVASQPLTLREADVQWDGGTLSDAELLGTVAVALRRGRRIRSDLEAGAGLVALSGARTLLPFATASRIATVGEAGISLRRGSGLDAVARQSAFDLRSLALFARYSVMRLDPGIDASAVVGDTPGTTGWVGRIAIGLRVLK